MSDKYDQYFESKEANEDSKSDARVALIVIVVFVIGAVFWVSGLVITQIRIFLHQELPCNQNQLK